MNVSDAANLLNRTHTQYLNAQRMLREALSERDPRRPAECGAEAGYMAHLRAGEAPCAACSYARSWANKKRRAGAA